MDDARFWNLVDIAKRAGEDPEDRVEGLEEALRELPAEEVQAFQATYEEMLVRACTWPLWGAAYLINGGCSDDGFRYFRDWLISEGEQVFEAAVADPDSLAALPGTDERELESYGQVAAGVYEELTGDEIEIGSEVNEDGPDGARWEDDDLPGLFPRLAAKYA